MVPKIVVSLGKVLVRLEIVYIFRNFNHLGSIKEMSDHCGHLAVSFNFSYSTAIFLVFLYTVKDCFIEYRYAE